MIYNEIFGAQQLYLKFVPSGAIRTLLSILARL